VAPWGLQPDPIGADGNLFFRGFFNLLLSVYAYVSGDSKWRRPFEMTGYQDRRFRWTHPTRTVTCGSRRMPRLPLDEERIRASA